MDESHYDAFADGEPDLEESFLDLVLVLVKIHDQGDETVGRDALSHNRVPLDEVEHLNH